MESGPAVASALDASEGRVALGAAFAEAVTGMTVVGLDGRILDANLAFCRLVDRPLDEIVGRTTAELTHPADRMDDGWWDELRSGRRTGDETYKRYLRPDGSVVHVVRSCSGVTDRDGHPVALLVQAVDVSATSEAREALARSEGRLHAMLAHASELTLLVEADGTIRFASPAAEPLLGYPADDLVGTSVFHYLHPDEVATAVDQLRVRLHEPGSPGRQEYRIRHSSGEWRRGEVRAVNRFDDPAIGAMLVNVRDVTRERRSEEQLAANEARLASLLGNAWDVVTLHEADGRYGYASPAVTGLLGYRPEELIGSDPFALLHPDDRDAACTMFESCAADPGGRRQLVYRCRHADGRWRWLESMAVNRLDDPSVAGVVVTSRDVTLARRRLAQQRATAILSAAALGGGDLEVLARQAVEAVGEAAGVEHCVVLRTTGGDLEEAARRGCLDLERDRAAARRALGRGGAVRWDAGAIHDPDPGAAASDDRAGVAVAIAGDGGAPWGAIVASTGDPGGLDDEDVSFFQATANVLGAAAKRLRIEEELRRRVLSDELTDLPNRTAFLDRLTRALRRLGRRPGSVAVLFIDTDDFKLVNDSLGHAAGDRVVKAVGQRITGVLRSSDTIARFGGDEFVVMCDGVDQAGAIDVAARIRAALGRPIDLQGRWITVTASIGIAVTRDASVSPEDLLAEADAAMYAAKRAGKDRACCSDGRLRRRATEALDTASALRAAVAGDQLELYYQPIVQVDDLQGSGWEALLRWRHPVHGLLGPDRFIDFAEASGLILPIGEWVLAQAGQQAHRWRERGCRGRMAVNVSARQLADPDFLTVVDRTLDRAGALPGDLTLELTETALMADVDRAAKVLQSLRDRGFLVGMDDFGTGHSSLSYLANLPLDFVKVDRSFVTRSAGDARAASLLEAIATICRTLGLPAVAEGVETEEQLERVARLGIPYAQGFLFGRPAPAAEVEQRRDAGRPA